jgi:two-component system, LytTR family, sensor kinase
MSERISPPAQPQPGPHPGLALGVWTLLGLCEASHSYFAYDFKGDPIRWSQALAMGLSLWYAWGVLSWPVFRLCQAAPLGHGRWGWRVPVHLLASVGFALVKLAMDYPIIKLFYCPMPHLLTFEKFYGMALASHFFSYVLIYFALVAVSHAIMYRRQFQLRAMTAARLESRLADARLQLLKAQLHPHFLFNTLHVIAALIHKDAATAERMLARLGDLLRLTLDHFGAREVTLRDELDFTAAYLEIEQVRYGPHLDVAWQVEPELLDARVPYLILQPLVENALRHGVGAKGGHGRVEIRAQRTAEGLRLEVEDDGPGLPSGAAGRRPGIGLANTCSRLRQLYGPDQTFALTNGDTGGVRAVIDLPLRWPHGHVAPEQEPDEVAG